MRIFHAIRRCEELTMENAQLRKEVAELRAKLKQAKDETEDKYRKIGNLISDNGRLIKVNAYLAEELGKKPRRRRIDENGDIITKQQ